MKKKRFCFRQKIGMFLLMVSVAFLPISPSLLLAGETAVPGSAAKDGKGAVDPEQGTVLAQGPGPSTERESAGSGGDAGPGATKGLKVNKWWWIGGGVVALGAILAASGGGGGGGGGGGSSSNH